MTSKKDDPLGFLKFVFYVVAAIVLVLILLVIGGVVGRYFFVDRPEIPAVVATIIFKPTQLVEKIETLTINNCNMIVPGKVITSKDITLSNAILIESNGKISAAIKNWLEAEIANKSSEQDIRIEGLEHRFELVAPENARTTFTITWKYTTSPGTAQYQIEKGDKESQGVDFVIYTNLDADVVSVSDPCR